MGAIAAVIIVSGVVLFAGRDTTADTNSAARVTMQTITSDVRNGGQLIDVRTPEEYASGHIEGAELVSLQSMQQGARPTAGQDKPIYVYCRSGNRSNQAAALLRQAGYQHVVDLGAITHVQSIGGSITK